MQREIHNRQEYHYSKIRMPVLSFRSITVFSEPKPSNCLSIMKLKEILRILEKGLLPMARLLDRLTWMVLFVMMTMTMADVLLRKLTNTTIIGAGEITEMMMAVVVFCSLAQCQVEEGHIRIDLIMRKAGPRIQSVVDMVTQFLCFGLFCLVTWSTFTHAMEIMEWEEVSIDLAIPIYPFVFIAAIGSAMLALILLYKAMIALEKVLEK
jgi:TRAP-type C4-dicarboxylate transport system permease small subunit